MKPDAIVIGGGHNGMAAALTLSKRGLRVLVLEARGALGGLCAPREFHPGFTAPGVLHDTTEIRGVLIDSLGLTTHGLALRAEEVPVHFPRAQGAGLTLWHDAARSASTLGADAAGYAALCEQVDVAKKVLNGLLNTAPPPLVPGAVSDYFDFARLGLSLRGMGAAGLHGFLRLLPMCIADVARDHLHAQAAQAALATGAVWGEFAGPWAPGTAARWILSRAVHQREVTGGPASVARALEKALAAQGVEVRKGARVAAVSIAGTGHGPRRVTGVRLESGEELGADSVGSSISPAALLALLPPQGLERKVLDELRAVRARGTLAKVHLALSSPIQTGDDAPFERLRIADTLEDLERAFDAVKYRRLPQAPWLDIRQPTLSDPSLAPQGRHVASVWVSCAPYALDGGWTDARRAELLSGALRRIERCDGKIREKVLGSEVLDPVSLERELGLSHGNVHHAEMTLDQMLFMRPTPRLAHYRTPIRGLFMCGSGSHPGGGVTLAPGTLGAQAALEGWN